MSIRNKAYRRNVLAAVACAAASTTTSPLQTDTWGGGIRFYITVTAVTTGGGTDTVFLCAVAPGTTTAIPLIGFSGVNQLSVAGTYIADFYPSAALPATVAAGSKLLGAAGIYLPSKWAAQVIMGAGNAATIKIDVETLP